MPQDIVNTFSPPFTYSYMCSSSVLTKFIPVFVLSNILLTFVLPALLLSLLFFSSKSVRCKAACMSFLPPILFPSHPVSKRLFSPHVIMSKLLHHLALLLTFGVACPPLALAILVTVCVTTLSWELVVGRYVLQRREAAGRKNGDDCGDDGSSSSGGGTEGEGGAIAGITIGANGGIGIGIGVSLNKLFDLYQQELFAMNDLCDGVWLCPQSIIWHIVDCTAFFSALFVFDISGDRSGWLVASLSFSLPLLLLPVVLRAMFKYEHENCLFSLIKRTRTRAKEEEEEARAGDGASYRGERESGRVAMKVLSEQTSPLSTFSLSSPEHDV
jgi:hypothetical protein